MIRESNVLLIHKMRGHGTGKVNVPGGHLERHESIFECARREVREEVGMEIPVPSVRACLRFQDLETDRRITGFVFKANKFKGRPVPTKEAKPFWCPLDEIPYDAMWSGDQHWMPSVLLDQTFLGDFLFDGNQLVSHVITPCSREELEYFAVNARIDTS